MIVGVSLAFPSVRPSAFFAVVGMAVSSLTLALVGPVATAAVSAPAAVVTPALKKFPLQGRALAAQLKPHNRALLPTVERWAYSAIGDAFDQEALMEVQIVSALHIYKVFNKKMSLPDATSALRISWRESRLLPNVVNDTNTNKTMDWGLFQLNDGGTLQAAGGEPNQAALRPRWNVRAAARLIAEHGWAPWGGPMYPVGT